MFELYFVIPSNYDRFIRPCIKEGPKWISSPVFRESVEIVEKLMLKIKSRIPSGTDLYVFCANDNRPSFDEIKRILKNNDMAFIDGVAQALSEAEKNGVIVRAADGARWNEEGHGIAAGVLEEYYAARL